MLASLISLNTIQCTVPFLHEFKNSVAGQIGSSRTATSTSSLLSNLLHRPKHESDGATSRPLNGPEVNSQTLATILVSHVRRVALFYLPAGTNPTTDDQLFSHKYPHAVAAPSQQTFTLTDVHRGMNSTWMTLLTSQNTDNTKADCFHRIPASFVCGAKWCTHISTLLFWIKKRVSSWKRSKCETANLKRLFCALLSAILVHIVQLLCGIHPTSWTMLYTVPMDNYNEQMILNLWLVSLPETVHPTTLLPHPSSMRWSDRCNHHHGRPTIFEIHAAFSGTPSPYTYKCLSRKHVSTVKKSITPQSPSQDQV